MPWTTRELELLQTTSRVSSAFSLAGAGFIILTFCTSSHFHRPINRLAFFASFGNILTNVATITSRDGIRAGPDSALCQAQATIIQWAIPADALFCLAMAWNVYLTVFKKRTTQQLRTLEMYYILACYGLPLLLAILLLTIRVPDRGRIYGPATLWCWIGSEWQVLRIAAFYGPVWIVLTVTFFIYVLAGRVIFNLRRNLRHFAKDDGRSSGSCTSGIRPPPPAHVRDVELQKIAQIVSGERASSLFPPGTASSSAPLLAATTTDPERAALSAYTTYTCHITSGASPAGHTPAPTGRTRPALEANTAAWAYCRCAMLFFLALFITWLPSSINRVYTLQYPDATDFGYNFAAALVLPCQGFWNGLIYVVTTLPACKLYFKTIGIGIRDIWRRMFGKKEASGGSGGILGGSGGRGSGGGGDGGGYFGRSRSCTLQESVKRHESIDTVADSGVGAMLESPTLPPTMTTTLGIPPLRV
ncbi:hypothetical protein EDC01DRAFT_704481 [Geopyxis carbonaria]|nr:hypothetical protein EDC01DRAFT_704481 [Geopyxis carbonaria]